MSASAAPIVKAVTILFTALIRDLPTVVPQPLGLLMAPARRSDFARTQTAGRTGAARSGSERMAQLDRTLIAGLPAFAGLTQGQLDAVLAHARSAHFARDSEIFGQGQEATSFHLLLSGHVRVVRASPEGHQVIARYIAEGELFGIAMAMGLITYPASAIAAADCVVLTWPNAAWPDLRERIPAFGASAYQTIGNRLQETQATVMEMATEQVEQRIARAVLRLVQQSGRKTAEGIEIDFPITRQEIAEMTGTTLHTVSRLLSGWEQQGLVRGGRQKVTVVDPHGLMLIAESRRKR
jgi:CRP-like cAMP-binding protein